MFECSSISRIDSYIKNANYSIENLSDNGELETCDGQLLVTTST